MNGLLLGIQVAQGWDMVLDRGDGVDGEYSGDSPGINHLWEKKGGSSSSSSEKEGSKHLPPRSVALYSFPFLPKARECKVP